MQDCETAHAQNTAQFRKLVSVIASFGEAYNPGREILRLSNLEIVLGDAELALKEVGNDTKVLAEAVRQREEAFEGLGKLAAQIGYALEISSVYRLTGDEAHTIIQKLQGKSAASGIKTADFYDDNNNPKNSPLSQMSFESRIENFERLVCLLESQKDFAPDEAYLQPAALRTRLAQLHAANFAALNAASALSGSRMVCREVIYDEESGLVMIADLVKKYVKSAFGADSPHYGQIKDLKFMILK